MTFKKILASIALGALVLFPASGHLQKGVKTGRDTVATSSVEGEKVVDTAMQYIGARYRHGHSGPTAFDCSGFTSFVYRQKNISLSRCSRTQYGQGAPVKNISDLKPGDLVFFGGSKSTRTVGHVGIVKEVHPERGDFSFVHAARSGVKVDVLSSAYYKKRYIGARRVL